MASPRVDRVPSYAEQLECYSVAAVLRRVGVGDSPRVGRRGPGAHREGRRLEERDVRDPGLGKLAEPSFAAIACAFMRENNRRLASGGKARG